MNTPTNEPNNIEADPIPVSAATTEKNDEARRRFLLIFLLVLLTLCCVAGYFIFRYIAAPQPLPQMIPVISNAYYQPTYKFSITLDKPVGVAVSPDAQRIYATESEKDRLIKMFDRDGKYITNFAPPFTSKSNRQLTYIAVNTDGRVFVVDGYNDVLCVFDKDGNFLDGLISRDVTLSGFVTKQVGQQLPAGTIYYYDNTNHQVVYQLPGQPTQRVDGPDRKNWGVMGMRFNSAGDLLITSPVKGNTEVLVYPAADINGSWSNFHPSIKEFGTEGKGNGQFSYPNSVVQDSKGNYYISDSNNGRISVWNSAMSYQSFFGYGSSDSALNLPRGIWMDAHDRLHVTDAVGGVIRVYDVSGTEPAFLASLGLFGTAEGQFNFPNDITMDKTGRLYIADVDNNRIQVWSY